jgi:hypothetical protein
MITMTAMTENAAALVWRRLRPRDEAMPAIDADWS